MNELKRNLMASCAIGFAILLPGNAMAQATVGSDKIETVVVTAEKRSEDMQKTPAAVTVVSGDELRARNVLTLPDLTNVLPATRINIQREFAVIYSRGLGQALNGLEADPAVEVDSNGMYIPREALEASLFDVESVQFLPGPQGTLYGRNAIAGALNINTKRPGDDYEADGFFEAGNYSLVHGFAGVTVPLSDDLSVRAAADYVKHEGYMTNGTYDKNELGVRLSVAYKPTEDLSLFVTGTHAHQGGVGFSQTVLPPDASWNTDPKFSDPWYSSPGAVPAKQLGNSQDGTIDLISAELNYKFGNSLTLTYIPGYLKMSNDGWNLFFFDYAPYKQSASIADVNEPWWQYSQELRLGQSVGYLNWVVGLYQYHSDATKFQDVYSWPSVAAALASAPVTNPGYPYGPTGTTIKAGPGLHSKAGSTVEDSYAIFGDGTYSLQDDLRVEVGLRYSYDEKHGFNLPSAGKPFDLSDSWGNLSGLVGLQYDVAPQSMLYAKIETGYLEGGYNTAAGTAIVPIPATLAPEQILAFTAGAKNRFFNDSLQINDEAYYYIVHNLQVALNQNLNPSGNVTAVSVDLNAKRATIYGNDLDVIYLPTDKDRFTLTVSLLHAVVDHYGLPANTYVDSMTGPVLATNSDFPGYALPFSPTVTINVGYSHTFALANNSILIAQVNTHYDSGEYQSPLNRGLPGSHQDAWHKTDASLTYFFPDGHWNISLWAKNMENRATYNAPAMQGGNIPATTILEPRTFGGRVAFQTD